MTATLADYYRSYAAATFDGFEPLYAAICRAVADAPQVLQIIAAHPTDAHQPNVILAAVRYLLADDPTHPLAAVYAGTSDADPGSLFCDLVIARRSEVDELLAWRRTQTNEVGRVAPIALGLAEIHRRADGPLAWIDLGASAGLNLLLDRLLIRYSVDDRSYLTGSERSQLAVDCELSGSHPLIEPVAPNIGWRIGIDRSPIYPTNDDDARWLRACLFPSRVERGARLDAALALAAAEPVELRKADAAVGLGAALAEAPADMPLVVTTTWVWYYLPVETRSAVLAAMADAGRTVYWLSIEGVGVVDGLAEPTADQAALLAQLPGEPCALGLHTFEPGKQPVADCLGWSHPHGSWVRWR